MLALFRRHLVSPRDDTAEEPRRTRRSAATQGSRTEEEKSRLQSLVDSFVKKAVRGCPSAHIDNQTGERTEAMYRIDRTLKSFTLAAKDDGRVIAECPIEEIQDIYVLDDGEDCLPPGVMRQVSPHERDCVLMVVHGHGHIRPQSLTRKHASCFCIVEESRERRDVFLESMRVFSIYAQHSQVSPAASPCRRNHVSP
jgi:hypothetical protein